ncbi:hypothetical protein HET73_02585 [Wolbachia endosymbiont of Atemnus politus]|uniref:hypothetical protein n=1 Tax=Wolbachia endosymbiont of Atemnus politus TaxID=2682840 RepID=UPI0015728254|nr:hypothetical protein [Wolbachia endosymbiont of Atemnus politus]NSM56457.1 hypothetical protein [Wolbachia endosymbiont of Atemnus politus]NSX83474.1 hypothetical protein [Wolbachia endosymbiont of Atemnus politus]
MSICKTFKNQRGQFYKMSIALVALTSLYVIGAAVALSAPFWVSSTSALALLAAFAATPPGIGILVTVAVALIGLAVYSIIKNNELSELKAPKIVNNKEGQQLLLFLTGDVIKIIKENNQYKDEKGKEIEGKYFIYFTNSEGKEGRVIIFSNQGLSSVGDTLCLPIHSLEVKNKEGKYEYASMDQQKATLGLDKDGAKGFNTYLG